MQKKVAKEYSPIVGESAETLGTEGLRTLVIAQKTLSEEAYEAWDHKYKEAKCLMENRDKAIRKTIRELEIDLDLLGITGVEDKLQVNVGITIERLKSAGIRVWMLTGDKVETAKCIAISSGIKSKYEKFVVLKDLPSNKDRVERELVACKTESALIVIDGSSLDICMKICEKEFFEAASMAAGVVCCRCSPTQKTMIVKKMKELTHKRCAAIGDGGNDVGMIQEGDCGIGIVGKEGMQASLAADFSVIFSYYSFY